jgi:hypothetical protein
VSEMAESVFWTLFSKKLHWSVTRVIQAVIAGGGEVWQGSEPDARFMCRKERDTTRGSPRSFAAQKALAQDDIKLHHLPERVVFWPRAAYI